MSRKDGTMVMPWGKYRGKTIEEIPSGYLSWLMDNCDDDDICEAADLEFELREIYGTHFWD